MLLNPLNSHPYELLLRKPHGIISIQNIGGWGPHPELRRPTANTGLPRHIPGAIIRPIMSTHASLKVNGQTHVVDVDPNCPLLYVLRDNLALNNPRFGCGLGQCGACTVIVDNRAVRSCLLPVSRAIGKEIVTLEGLGTPGSPHPVQAAFIEEQTFQCGYCLNGWVMSAKAFLDKNPNPSDADVRKAFESLVCRCGSHARIFSAVHRAAADMKRSA